MSNSDTPDSAFPHHRVESGLCSDGWTAGLQVFRPRSTLSL